MEGNRKIMRWYNLKKNRCPQCNSNLTFSAETKNLGCHNCGLKVSDVAFNRIVNEMVTKELNEIEGDVDIEGNDKTGRNTENDDIW